MKGEFCNTSALFIFYVTISTYIHTSIASTSTHGIPCFQSNPLNIYNKINGNGNSDTVGGAFMLMMMIPYLC